MTDDAANEGKGTMFRPLLALLVVVLLSCSGAQDADNKRLALARTALSEGKLDVARANAEAVHDSSPDHVEAKRILAAVHRELAQGDESAGSLARARNNFIRAAELEPNKRLRAEDWYSAYRNANDLGEEAVDIVGFLVSSLDADPSNLDVRRAAATTYDELNEPRVAANHYLWLYEADRSDIGIGLRLGALYGTAGEWDDAEAIFRRVLDADPENVQAKLQLADAYENLGRGARARQIYQELEEDHPDNAMILFRYADFLTRRGDESTAERLRARARGELPGVERREMRELKRRKKKKKR